MDEFHGFGFCGGGVGVVGGVVRVATVDEASDAPELVRMGEKGIVEDAVKYF